MYRIRYVRRAVALVIGLVMAAMPGERTVRSVQAQPSVQTVVEPEAVSNKYLHTVWTIEDGLPQNTVNAILQTRDGYLWLATFGGLVRFDGVSFTVFDVANAPELASNRMLSLYEDREGALWIGHEREGVSRYEGGVFTRFGEGDGLTDGDVLSFAEDREGVLWIGTSNGLVHYEGGQFTLFTSADGLPSGKVSALHVDREGVLWAGTGWMNPSLPGGLVRYREGRFEATPFLTGLGWGVASILEDQQGTLWVGMGDGLMRLDEGRLERVYAYEGRGNTISALHQDQSGNLWFTAGDGIAVMEQIAPGTATGDPEWAEAQQFNEGVEGQVRSIFEDREGNLWVGTNGYGLVRLRRKQLKRYLGRDGLPAPSVLPVIADGQGGLWLGSGCDGLTHFQAGRFTTYPLLGGCVNALLRSRDGVLWIGHNQRITQLQEGVFTTVVAPDSLYHMGNVRALFQDREGTLWAGTGTGLFRFQEGQWEGFSATEGLVDNDVHFITQDQAGALWVGTRAGLSRFQADTFTNYTAENGLAPGMVRAIHEDTDGTLWIGTYGGGLSRLKDGVFTRYTMDDGLFDNVISRILEDDRGNLWMLGNLGLFYINRQVLNDFAEGLRSAIASVSLGPDEGMAEGNGGSQPAGWQTEDGKMWFPTINGIVVVDAKNFMINEVPPPVMVERAIFVGHEFDLRQPIEASAGLRDVEIHYTGLSLSAPEKVRFRYKLEGHDAMWQDVGRRRAAYYTSLSPGSYQFRVQAANNDGVWNEVGATLTFSLAPHFYETVWFLRTLCTLAWLGRLCRISDADAKPGGAEPPPPSRSR